MPFCKFAVGLIVTVPPVIMICGSPIGMVAKIELSSDFVMTTFPVPASTTLLNVITKLASFRAPVELSAGDKLVMAGGTVTTGVYGGVALFRAAGVAGRKSVALLSVSREPESLRETDLVLLGAGDAPLPSNALGAVPKPIKSMMLEPPTGLVPAKAVVPFTNAILPVVPERLMVVGPTRSGVGRSAPTVLTGPKRTR